MAISTHLMAIVLATSVAAATAQPLADFVEAHQLNMRSMAELSKAINDYFVGRRPYDETDFTATARLLQEHASKLIAQFDDVIDAPGSFASPFIRADRPSFDAFARHLETYAAQIGAEALNAKEIPSGMRMKASEASEGGPFANPSKEAPDLSSYTSEHAFHMMLQTCTACHAKFRIQAD